MTIPDGHKPIATWGPHTPHWVDSRINEKIAWVKANIPRHKDALRAEFYQTPNGPIALVRYYALNANGRKHNDATGQIALEPQPVIVPLSELPPAHLLGTA